MSKYEVVYSKLFRKNIKKHRKDIKLIKYIIKRLANDEILEPKYKDHALKGNMRQYKECHVKPDLLLVYRKDKDILVLTCINMGSHSKVF